ncbi:hypothetical protein N658DRAFT_261827 [Parathielavia hyrcaniae]|uniref:Uncharacterized protein n=1 Tax=Parathielavia hyrcaniae TaxID=113614 RepID=A0AAN6PYN6_9PEZI|nr:hypothetical protein N658DRAFT_261827 [Parathielavia hyrcaniae]
MYEDLVTHARRRAADLGRRLPCFWSSPPKDLPEWLVSLLDYIAAMHEPETLARITLDDILGLISNCGFDDRDQAERELRSHCYDLYRNVLDTWPEDAPIVEWLSDAVPTSFRKVKLDKEIEKGLLTKLRPPSPLELSAWAPKTQEPGSTPLDPPRGAAQSLQVPVCGHTSRVAALNINGNASIDKSERMRFTNWKFREGSSDAVEILEPSRWAQGGDRGTRPHYNPEHQVPHPRSPRREFIRL